MKIKVTEFKEYSGDLVSTIMAWIAAYVDKEKQIITSENIYIKLPKKCIPCDNVDIFIFIFLWQK